MLKSPLPDAYTCWRTLALQTRSTKTSFGTGVLSLVATRPERNSTRFPLGWVWSTPRGRGVVGLLDGSERGGWGGGAGAGGFCAAVTGTRSKVESARRASMRMQWLIGQFPGRARLRCRIVGRKSVQVKATELNQRNSLDRVDS